MGFYINPKTETKEKFLKREATPIYRPPLHLNEIPANKVLVCLVHNGSFTAAGICYSSSELDAWRRPTDKRPKIWYLIDRDKVVGIYIPAEKFTTEERA